MDRVTDETDACARAFPVREPKWAAAKYRQRWGLFLFQFFSLKWNLGQEQMEKQCLLSFREIEDSVFFVAITDGRAWLEKINS